MYAMEYFTTVKMNKLVLHVLTYKQIVLYVLTYRTRMKIAS